MKVKEKGWLKVKEKEDADLSEESFRTPRGLVHPTSSERVCRERVTTPFINEDVVK